MMSRPMLLVLLMLVLIITSQFEWKQQQLVVDVDSNSSVSQRQQQRVSKGVETVKDKIILVQEQNIRRLNELVRHLQEQLQQCRSGNGTRNGTAGQLAQHTLDLSDIKF